MTNSESGVSARVFTTIALLVPGAVVPFLEVNATHLLNGDWPAHARLHEAWQLLTNSLLALAGIYWTWSGRASAANVVGMIVSGSFVSAWLVRDSFGGSLHGTTTAGIQFMGIDVALLVMVTLFFVFAIGWRSSAREGIQKTLAS